MKKLYLFSLIAFSLVSINAFAQDEDLHDAAVLSEHFKSPQQFTTWYKGLNQENKDLVLAGTIYTCKPDLTKTALAEGGNINTKISVINITSGHDDHSSAYIYAYSSGDIDDFMMKVIAAGMAKSAQAVKEESCGHTFSHMSSGTPGLMSLISASIKFCPTTDTKAKMLQLLKSNGSDINETNYLHVSPLSEAIEQKNIKIIELLLQNGADFSKTFALSRMIDEYDTFHTNAETEAIWDYVIAYLQNHKLTPEAETDAYIKGRLRIKYLHTPEADIDLYTDDFDAAWIKDRLEEDNRLNTKLEQLNLHPDYSTIAAKEGILAAAEQHKYTLLQELVDNGVDVNYQNEDGRTALFHVTNIYIHNLNDEDIEAIKYLLNHGADINHQDKYGRTALFHVTNTPKPSNKDIEAIKYLLNHGADTSIKDKDGKTAFDDCAYKICKLSPYGMRKFSPDDKTIIPTLRQAIDENDCATIVELINKGIDPYINIGTALFFRMYHTDNRKCLKNILDLGIDLNKVVIIRDDNGDIKDIDTALTYAEQYFWSQDIIPLLKQYGATETDDVQRIRTYKKIINGSHVIFGYDAQKEASIRQKLKEKDLKDWEIEVYQQLLKEQEYMKIHENDPDPVDSFHR